MAAFGGYFFDFIRSHRKPFRSLFAALCFHHYKRDVNGVLQQRGVCFRAVSTKSISYFQDLLRNSKVVVDEKCRKVGLTLCEISAGMKFDTNNLVDTTVVTRNLRLKYKFELSINEFLRHPL